MSNSETQAIIDTLALVPTEGGWYRETFRDMPSSGGRGASRRSITCCAKASARWHRVDAFEVWHFYAGDPLALYIAEPDESVRTTVLGVSLALGQVAHAVVPANLWQAAEPLGAYALLGCTVAPRSSSQALSWRPRDGGRILFRLNGSRPAYPDCRLASGERIREADVRGIQGR